MIKKKAFASKRFWAGLGRDARTLYQNYIFDEGHNVYGSKWWGGKYSPEYEKAKKAGSFKRQADDFAGDVTAVLTSDLMNDFEEYLKPFNTGFEFGYPEMGDRVKSLRKRKGKKGTLTSKDKPVPTVVSKFIKAEYSKWVRKNSKPTTRIHKGKKLK